MTAALVDLNRDLFFFTDSFDEPILDPDVQQPGLEYVFMNNTFERRINFDFSTTAVRVSNC